MGKIEIDWGQLANMEDGTQEGIRTIQRLIRLFEESCESGVARIREAMDAGDRIQLFKSLHKLRGSCGTLGAVSVSKAISELERFLETGMDGSPSPGIATIEALITLTSIEFTRKYPETIASARRD
jgi:HPt (histidine-containing phosphotransfer) domain-containing protein